MFSVYILYSAFIDRYYVGFTSERHEERLRKHLAHHDGFTSKAKDWVIKHLEYFDTKEEAVKREQEIKKWKSRKKIEELIRSTE
jgi:putative endonuclease